MGGSGAKVRRKLQRQKEVDIKDTSSPNKAVAGDNNSSKARVTTHTPLPKVKKVKKPKHLKRKLINANDEESRQKLEEQMAMFEQQKTHKEKKRRRIDQIDLPTPVLVEDYPRTSLEENNTNIEDGIKQEQGKTKEPEEMKSVSLKQTEDPDPSSDEGSVTEEQKRQRGNRRRGRKDTSKIVEGQKKEEQLKKKKEDTRYCIGRKPLTDFVLWQSYEGKVVYVKPFGVFVDIGCHSDAFCHISRLRDDFIESAEISHKAGDAVKVRVVEIDRKRKQITVSMQSDARIADERASIEARQERHKKREMREKKKSRHALAPDSERVHQAPKPNGSKESNANNMPPTKDVANTAKSERTPAEVKRDRKLARRAARRETRNQQVANGE